MGLAAILSRISLGVMLRRWWRRHAGVRAFAYAALYPTFLVPAYLLPYLLLVALHGVEPGAALDAWNPMFLLLPVCLLAPYALTRGFVRETRWPARLSATATVLGLGAILDMALAVEVCREVAKFPPVPDSLLVSLVCPMWFWGGLLVAAVVLHVLVIVWGAKAISALAAVSEEEEGAEREAVAANDAAPKPNDGGISGTGAKAEPDSVWSKGAAWARKTARRGAAGASSGADALWRKAARPRAAAASAARVGKRRLASAWRGLRDGLSGAAEKRGGGPDEGGTGS